MIELWHVVVAANMPNAWRRQKLARMWFIIVCIVHLASSLGSPCMFALFCTANNGKLGGAWERGYCSAYFAV